LDAQEAKAQPISFNSIKLLYRAGKEGETGKKKQYNDCQAQLHKYS